MLTKADTVDEFLDAQSPEDRAVFSKLRALLKKSRPGIVESMKWKMPSYGVGENYFAAFNRQKNYLSLYIDSDTFARFRKEFEAAGLDCGKCCIRFRKPAHLPLDLAAKIIKHAAKQATK